MMKVLSIIGTRPEAIKMAPVIKAIERNSTSFESIVCATAQHREMLDQVLNLFEVKPDMDLDVMRPNQDLHSLTARIVEGVGIALKKIRPDVLLIQGDTTTVMGASIAAFYEKIPIGHVEAGLRTSNIYSPFPEEVNRRIVSVVASYHFSPTEVAARALLEEGVSREKIFVTGNTVIDALHMILARPCPPLAEKLLNRVRRGFDSKTKLILVTAHRRENFGMRFENICRALLDLVKRNSDIVLVYPVHMNPNIKEPAGRILGGKDRIILTDPFDYAVLAHLMKASHLVLTDSGGLQEEAPSLGKPVLVMREETERPEGVSAGTARLVGSDPRRILNECERLLTDVSAYEKMASAINPYGDGQASERIVQALSENL